jgi:8-oxo-dGTP diphosphatase
MRFGTNGIVTNAFGEVLLILRDDTRTFAPPGGSMEAGELPTDNVAREVKEETGLIVLPVRLVGLYYMDWGSSATLDFCFRCIQRGGELATSAESLQVGFYPANKLPAPMVGLHRQRIEQGFSHDGGAPYWGVDQQGWYLRLGRLLLNGLYRWRDWQRKRRGEPLHAPAAAWKTGALAVIGNGRGEVLWLKRDDVDCWNLPGGGGKEKEAPWETAVRQTNVQTGLTVDLTDLTSVYVYENEAHAIFTFSATDPSGALTTGLETDKFAWFTPGQEPDNSFAIHVEAAADALSETGFTQFRFQPVNKK